MFSCQEPECSARTRVFRRRRDLNKHIKWHNPQYECSLCPQGRPRRFAERSQLNRHLHTHRSEKTRKDFPCAQCNRSFIRLEHLKRHITKKHEYGAAQEDLSCLTSDVHGQELKATKEQAGLDLKLIEAVCGGNVEAVQHLVAKGANINFEVEDGSRSLEFAIRRGHLDIAHHLKGLGATLNNDRSVVLWAALRNDDDHAVQILLSWGASLDVDKYYGTLLKRAICSRQETIAERLIHKYQVDVNASGVVGHSPLIMAIVWSSFQKQNMRFIELLIASGANLSPSSSLEGMPLAAAATADHFPVQKVKFLLQHGAIPTKEILAHAQNGLLRRIPWLVTEERRNAVDVIRQWLRDNTKG